MVENHHDTLVNSLVGQPVMIRAFERESRRLGRALEFKGRNDTAHDQYEFGICVYWFITYMDTVNTLVTHTPYNPYSFVTHTLLHFPHTP